MSLKKYQINGKSLKIPKSYTKANYFEDTILTDDVFSYVDFYFIKNRKKLKMNPKSKLKVTNRSDYHYQFYWNQSKQFYIATTKLPFESKALTSYYAILNAAKAFIVYRSAYLNVAIDNFYMHGLNEKSEEIYKNLNDIGVRRKKAGVFTTFSKLIDPQFEIKWEQTRNFTLKELLYNLSFVHRAYHMTYKSSGKKIEDLFIPLDKNETPYFYMNDSNQLQLKFSVNPNFFGFDEGRLQNMMNNELNKSFEVDPSNRFTLLSKKKSKVQGSLSSSNKVFIKELRDRFHYISSSDKLWYIKRNDIPSMIDLNPMILIFAIMHRLSEIERYKPEQLFKIMHSSENWILNEFLTLALDQFMDEISCEITGTDLMPTRHRT